MMLRKMMIALFACASVAVLAPDAALARGGFGGGGGGFHGGGGGGFRGGGMGMGGGGFRSGGMGMGGGFRAAAVSVRPLCRPPDFVAAPLPPTVSTVAGTTVSGIGDFRLPRQRSASA